MKAFLLTLFIALMLVTDVHGADRNPAYEDVLIPIFADGYLIPGAFGTQWETVLWARNGGSSFVAVHQGAPGCSIGICEPQGLSAHTTTRVADLLAPLLHNPGRLLHVENSGASSVFLSLRLRETTTGLRDELELPVVRETEFYDRPIELLDVPVQSNHRIHLRVYDPRAIVGTRIRISVFPMQSEESLGSEVLLVGGGDLAVEPQEFPPFPGFAEIQSLEIRFPAILSQDRIRIVLTPETTGTEFWAMVSVTDNESQHVNLITPQ